MSSNKPIYDKVTLVDVQLASAYYPILVDLAKHKHCLTYGELVVQAKKTYPDLPVVQKAIAVSTGRRLDVVRRFTSERGLPDLSALIINSSTGECGAAFTKNFDPVATRDMVFSFNWHSVNTDFDGFVCDAERSIKTRKKIKESVALDLMSQYFLLHKANIPSCIREHRDLIVELIMEGFEPAYVFAQAALLCREKQVKSALDGNDGQ
jgi:hypothetical protein